MRDRPTVTYVRYRYRLTVRAAAELSCLLKSHLSARLIQARISLVIDTDNVPIMSHMVKQHDIENNEIKLHRHKNAGFNLFSVYLVVCLPQSYLVTKLLQLFMTVDFVAPMANTV